MSRKRKKQNNSWIKNIEYIFTEEKLNEFVKQGFLERIKRNNRFHYVKSGCRCDFNPEDYKEK